MICKELHVVPGLPALAGTTPMDSVESATLTRTGIPLFMLSNSLSLLFSLHPNICYCAYVHVLKTPSTTAMLCSVVKLQIYVMNVPRGGVNSLCSGI